MRGNNFFEPYIEKNSFDFKGKNIIILSLLLLVLASIMFPLVTKIRVFKMNREITKINSEINSKENQIKKIEVDNIKKETVELKEKSEILDLIASDFYKKDNVGDFLVNSITDSMAGAMFLKDIAISGAEISLVGISKEKQDIAMFERNLRRVSYFKDVFIPSIKLDEGFYEFDINIDINSEAVNLKKQEQLDEVKDQIDTSTSGKIEINTNGGETKVETE